MNRFTEILLFCLALFFGLAIVMDRLSVLQLFEGMDTKKKTVETMVESPVTTHKF